MDLTSCLRCGRKKLTNSTFPVFQGIVGGCPAGDAAILRGMMWNKQFYHYDVRTGWTVIRRTASAEERLQGRNHDWTHLYNDDIISMPDKWSIRGMRVDLAFHTIPIALIDRILRKNSSSCCCASVYAPERAIAGVRMGVRDVNPPYMRGGFSSLQN